jgi:hypothetical protein
MKMEKYKVYAILRGSIEVEARDPKEAKEKAIYTDAEEFKFEWEFEVKGINP